MKKIILMTAVVLGFAFVSNAQKKYSIGLHPELGGYVFKLSDDKMHGLVAETEDIEGGWNWYTASEIVKLACVHSSKNQNFKDWRLPTKDELNEMMKQSGSIGNFTMEFYWSSTESSKSKSYGKDPSVPFQGETDKFNAGHVRAVREF